MMAVNATEKVHAVSPRRNKVHRVRSFKDRRRFNDDFRNLHRRDADTFQVKQRSGIARLLAAAFSTDFYPSRIPSPELLARGGIDRAMWSSIYQTLRLNTVHVDGLDMNALKTDRGYTVDESGRTIRGMDIERLLGQIEDVRVESGLAKHGALAWSIWVVSHKPDLTSYQSVLDLVNAIADRYAGEEIHSIRNITMVYDYSPAFRDLVNEIIRLNRRGVSELAGLYEPALVARYFSEKGSAARAAMVMDSSYDDIELELVRKTYRDAPTPENQVVAALLHRVQAHALLRKNELKNAALHENRARLVIREVIAEADDAQLELLSPLSLKNDALYRAVSRAWRHNYSTPYPSAMWAGSAFSLVSV
jgi:hypothetical protein